MAGMAVGAVWLVAIGQWQYIGIGIMAIFFSPYILPILILPAGMFSFFMVTYANAGRKDKERVMFMLSLAYILAFMAVWCAGLFYYATYAAQPQTLPANIFWGVIVSVMPLLWWSSQDRENLFILSLVEIMQVAVLVLAACRYFELVTGFWPMVFLVGVIGSSLLGLQVLYEKKVTKKLDASGS